MILSRRHNTMYRADVIFNFGSDFFLKFNNDKVRKQAGAEMCQAQDQLGLNGSNATCLMAKMEEIVESIESAELVYLDEPVEIVDMVEIYEMVEIGVFKGVKWLKLVERI